MKYFRFGEPLGGGWILATPTSARWAKWGEITLYRSWVITPVTLGPHFTLLKKGPKKVTGWTRGFPFHLVFFSDPSTGIWHGFGTRRSEGHDLDLGQHVLQAGRADGTATDGSPTFGGNGNERWKGLDKYSRIVSFLRPSVNMHFFYVYGFVVRFRLDHSSFQFDHTELSRENGEYCNPVLRRNFPHTRTGEIVHVVLGWQCLLARQDFPSSSSLWWMWFIPRRFDGIRCITARWGTVEDGRVLEHGNAEFTYIIYIDIYIYMTVPRCYSEI